jgi:hypothetical protein
LDWSAAREQNKIGQALGQTGGEVSKIGVVALKLLLDQIVDVAMQAIRHSIVPVGVRRAPYHVRMKPTEPEQESPTAISGRGA